MKQFLMTFTIVAFLVNGFAVSSWAKPCLDDHLMSKTIQNQIDMPCHSTADTEESNQIQHCEGVCLCFHASLNHTPILSQQMPITGPVFYKSDYNIVMYNPTLSDIPTGIFRPPIR